MGAEPRYPASTGQEAIWVAERLTSVDGAYMEAFAWRLRPAPDAERLANGLRAVVARHEVLRSGLVLEGGRLWQVVRSEGPPLMVVDGWSEERLAAWLRRPIDVGRASPMRAVLVLGRQGAMLGLALHHSVVDSWSLPLLLDEWAAGGDEAPTQFGPWAAAERDASPGEVPPELADLLRGRRPDAHEREPEAVHELRAGPVLASHRLLDASRRLRMTPFELVAHAAVRAVRAELGPADTVLGTIVSRRDTAEAQRMLGYCAATVPLACPPDGDLEQTRAAVRLARSVRHVPPASLLARVGRRTAPGRHPLFDAVLVFERGEAPVPAFGEATPLHVPIAAAKFDLTLTVRDDGRAVLAGADGKLSPSRHGRARAVVDALGRELELLADGASAPLRRRPPAAPRPEPAPRAAGPPAAGWRDAMEMEVAAAWQEVLARTAAGPDEDFFAAGGDSLAAIHLCAALRRRCLPPMEPAELMEAGSIAALARRLRAAPEPRRDPCLVRLRAGSGPAVVLVHPIGGTVTWYAPLVRLLRTPAPIWALQARGLTPGQPFHRSIAAMAGHYARLVAAHLPRPRMIGGYSMGGTIAAQLARCLADEATPAGALLLLDTSARQARRSDPHYAVRVLVERALRLRFDWRTVAEVPRERQAEAILAAAQAAGRLPGDWDAERLRRMLEVYDHNSAALASHEPATLAGPALLVRTDSEEGRSDPTLGWGGLLPDLTIRVAPGDHFNLLDPPNASAVAALVDEYLAAS